MRTAPFVIQSILLLQVTSFLLLLSVRITQLLHLNSICKNLFCYETSGNIQQNFLKRQQPQYKGKR